MSNENLKDRTKKFALDVIKFVEALPDDRTSRTLGNQLLRAGTSVGANYRAASRAKSPADFISKMGTVEEEADETAYWMELLILAGKTKEERTNSLLLEADELTAIAVSSINTAKRTKGRGNSEAGISEIPHSALRTPHS
ncbi:MAG: four helix bundle protein [Verrucomicrobia bacterium]|nr:four helix bundle protein [Verrucomicrobiota bacterium]